MVGDFEQFPSEVPRSREDSDISVFWSTKLTIVSLNGIAVIPGDVSDFCEDRLLFVLALYRLNNAVVVGRIGGKRRYLVAYGRSIYGVTSRRRRGKRVF